MDENKKNNSPNGWTDGELNGRLENNSPNTWTDGELNDWLKNNSPDRWTDGKLKKITRQTDGRVQS